MGKEFRAESLTTLAEKKLAPRKSVTIRQWFFDNIRPLRDTCFKICFALEMSPQQTSLFLNKTCFENSFNFRNPKEILYFYCIKYNKSYKRAMALLERYGSAIPTVSAGIEHTSLWKKVVNQMEDNDDAFVNKLVENKLSLNSFSQTARSFYDDFKNRLCEEINKHNQKYFYENLTRQKLAGGKDKTLESSEYFHTGSTMKTSEPIGNDALLKELFSGIPYVTRNVGGQCIR